MSYRPPPAFGPTNNYHDAAGQRSDDQRQSPPNQTTSPRGKTGYTKRRTWSNPAFVMVGQNQTETIVAEFPDDLPLQGLSPATVKAQATIKTTSGSPGVGSSKPKRKVGWNPALFVVDRESGPREASATTSLPSPPLTLDFDDLGEQEIQMPSRDSLGFKSILSRKECSLLDDAVLKTRLEWSQLLVSKALKPYRQMICAADDDLPNPQDMEELDEATVGEDVLEGKKELIKIREKMLQDPDLTEKEIAVFFEGFQLFRMKVNSLQSQLDGMESMHKLGLYASKTQRTYYVAPSSRKSLVKPQLSQSALVLPRRLASVAENSKALLHQNQPTNTVPEPRNQQKNNESQLLSPPPQSRSIRMMSIQRIRKETATQDDAGDIRKLLEELEEAERRQKKLEKQLAQAGVVIAEDIPYEIAKEKVQNIAKRMAEIGGSDVDDAHLREEYFKLEQEMERYSSALQLTEEWATEQEEMERTWEESVAKDNEEAAMKLRRHMPVDVRNRSEASLATEPTPNGKYLPRDVAKKFKRSNVLQLLRTDPDDIFPMHAATLENMRMTGLTLTERQALYHHLKDLGPRWQTKQGDKMVERKWTWFNMMKSKLKESLGVYQRHVEEYGPPDNHHYASRDNGGAGGCPLVGKQCSLKANLAINYDGDFGYPEGPLYFKTEVKKSEIDDLSKARHEAQEALKQRRAEERSAVLKSHYKGKILQVSLANGSCEMMDDAMSNMENIQESWLRERYFESDDPGDAIGRKELSHFHEALNDLKLTVLQFAEKSGMQVTGKRDTNVHQVDVRSMTELALCEEVIEVALDFFEGIEERMTKANLKDGRIAVTIDQLRELLDELHQRNLSTIEELKEPRPPRSRPFRSRKIIAKKVKDSMGKRAVGGTTLKDDDAWRDPTGGDRAQRGDLLCALKGKDENDKSPVRVDLLSALNGRGVRGEGGRGPAAGSLFAAIAAREQQS